MSDFRFNAKLVHTLQAFSGEILNLHVVERTYHLIQKEFATPNEQDLRQIPPPTVGEESKEDQARMSGGWPDE